MLSMHCGLVGSFDWVLELAVLDDIMRLTSQEVLLELFGVNSRGLEGNLTRFDDSLKVWINFSIFLSSGDLGGFCSINLFGSQEDFIESWCFFSSSSQEEWHVWVDRRFLVFDNSVNISYSKVDSLGKLILVIDFDPLFDVLSLLRHNIIGDIKLPKSFLFEHYIILCSLWWLSKLISVRSLLCHLSQLLLCQLIIKGGWINLRSLTQ